MEIQPLSPEPAPARPKTSKPPLLSMLPAECTELIMTELGSDLGRFAAVCRSAADAAKPMWRDAYQVRQSIHTVASATPTAISSAWPHWPLLWLLPIR